MLTDVYLLLHECDSRTLTKLNDWAIVYFKFLNAVSSWKMTNNIFEIGPQFSWSKFLYHNIDLNFMLLF